MTSRSLAACAAVLLLASTPVAAAAADDVAAARVQYEAGARLFHAGKYREAIARFEAAYRLKPHGAIHFNVAQCRERLGEWPAALRSYQDYLRELPEARDRAAVRAAIVRLERRLAGAGVQALLVYSDPPGAAVRLDGKGRGRTPFHITLPPGVYHLALSLEGYAPEAQDVEVNLAASRVVEAVLQPEGMVPPRPAGSTSPAVAAAPPRLPPTSSMTSGVPVAGQPPGAAPAAAAPDLRPSEPPLPVTGPPVPEVARPAAWSQRRILAWSLAAAAAVAVAGGVSYGLEARRLSSSLRDGTTRTTAEADALASNARRHARTANVLYGIGGAAAAAGATLFVLEGRF